MQNNSILSISHAFINNSHLIFHSFLCMNITHLRYIDHPRERQCKQMVKLLSKKCFIVIHIIQQSTVLAIWRSFWFDVSIYIINYNIIRSRAREVPVFYRGNKLWVRVLVRVIKSYRHKYQINKLTLDWLTCYSYLMWRL